VPQYAWQRGATTSAYLSRIDYPGGKLSAFELDGYRFDAGPSLFTMPQYVDTLFQLAGEDPKDYFQYQRLDTVCRYFWEDGTRLSALPINRPLHRK
jgi:phytoene dehydrogenase-like protein